MRISDWSSDVCSSDLAHVVGGGVDVAGQALQLDADRQAALQFGQQVARLGHREGAGRDEQDMVCFYSPVFRVDDSALDQRQQVALHALAADRSEEHTSELQSLMRISYAVFCLKKKKNNNTGAHNSQQHTHTRY